MVSIIREINTFIQTLPKLAEQNLGKHRDNTDMTNAKIADIMIQVIKVTIHLHNQNIIHRDLNPENILVFENGQKFQICDFGKSQLQSDSNSLDGKSYFKAPEIGLSDEFSQSSKVDIWSLGMILYYLCTKKYKYQDKIISDIKHLDQTIIIKLEGDQKLFEDLLNEMLQFNPAKRIDAQRSKAKPSIFMPLVQYEDGDMYQGEYDSLTNQRDGRGRYIHSNGAVYDGLWKNNQLDGFGRQIYDSGDYYLGEWKDGKANGYGEYYWKDGKIYKGQWVNNKKEGLRLLRLSDGDQYYGQQVNGKGVGVYTYNSGDILLGQYMNDYAHGIQMSIPKDGGQIQIGKYQNGELIETLLKIDNNASKCIIF
ncbi:morn repeat protein [Stylonychia lemnae]|uniref:Morn repeat protein n=1 Tax=Stylonychia lemnae TaxID=5949 RepID=A0A077ZXH5_STYLE|nr:morn repeat protein [Stylonychia lemnae]|eukprot:CDW74605.1 morn repeat protein [Stylonychia lemnae]